MLLFGFEVLRVILLSLSIWRKYVYKNYIFITFPVR